MDFTFVLNRKHRYHSNFIPNDNQEEEEEDENRYNEQMQLLTHDDKGEAEDDFHF